MAFKTGRIVTYISLQHNISKKSWDLFVVMYNFFLLPLLLHCLYRLQLLFILLAFTTGNNQPNHREEVCEGENDDFEYPKHVVVDLGIVVLRIEDGDDDLEECVNEEGSGDDRSMFARLERRRVRI